MIEANRLSMRYGSVVALAESTFTARRGEVLGLLGPNGAGKTTTMRILTTYQHPTTGTARVAGFDVIEEPLEVRRRIGYLPEALPLYTAMEVRECLDFVGRARGLRGRDLAARVDWVLARCGLERMYRTPCMQLSKGFRQRTALAQALLHDPEVVILDEPTTGLDPHQILGIRELVRELAETKTVILSTHILHEAAAVADRLLVMSRGRIAGSGTVSELLIAGGVLPRVRVRISMPDGTDAADPERSAIVDALLALDPVEDVLAEPANAPELSLTIRGRDLDAAPLELTIGRFLHDRGLVVSTLARLAGDLEDAFIALTRGEDARASATGDRGLEPETTEGAAA